MIADNHPVIRKMIVNVLGNESDMEVIGEAADGQAAVALAAGLQPDVILMDMSLPKLTGVEATHIIHNDWPDICIIGWSMFEDADTVQCMTDAGAAGYVTKSGHPEVLIDTIRTSSGNFNKGLSTKAED